MNKKNIKTAEKPAYIVDATNCENAQDLLFEFAIAKHNANIPLTDEELSAIVGYSIDMYIENEPPRITVVNCECKPKTKKPWYKRFWNWLFGRK